MKGVKEFNKTYQTSKVWQIKKKKIENRKRANGFWWFTEAAELPASIISHQKKSIFYLFLIFKIKTGYSLIDFHVIFFPMHSSEITKFLNFGNNSGENCKKIFIHIFYFKFVFLAQFWDISEDCVKNSSHYPRYVPRYKQLKNSALDGTIYFKSHTHPGK